MTYTPLFIYLTQLDFTNPLDNIDAKCVFYMVLI